MLSVVVMLFMIGLIVMIFSLMGAGIRDSSTVQASETTTAVDTSVTLVDGAGNTLNDCDGANQGVITSIGEVNNASTILTSGNYTFSGCVITATAGAGIWNNTAVSNVTYTYTSAGESWDVMNDTVAGVSGVTDWFDIFIVIGAMVVLILLTVIIITAIRSSGMVAQ